MLAIGLVQFDVSQCGLKATFTESSAHYELDNVNALLPNHIPYYKLYYPNGKETDCNDLSVLCVAAFTWYCYKDSVAAGSMTNYGMAKNYFNKHFLRMAMTPVPDEMYTESSNKNLAEYQMDLEDMSG